MIHVDPAPLHELLQGVDVGGHARDEDATLLLGLLGDRQRVDVSERADAEVLERRLRGDDEPPPRRPRRQERHHDEHERGRAPAVDERGAERRGEAMVEDLLDEHRRDQRGDRHAERHHDREREAATELGALADPAPQDRPRALELRRDLDRVVGVRQELRGRGHQRSPRSYAWMIAAYPGMLSRSSSCGPVAFTTPSSRKITRSARPDRGQAIRDHDQGRGELAAERRQDVRLDRGVDRGRGVVEDQHPRLADQRPGERDPLPLAPREGVAALADDRVVALGQLADEPVGPRDQRRAHDLGLADLGVQGDVRCARSSRTGTTPGRRSRPRAGAPSDRPAGRRPRRPRSGPPRGRRAAPGAGRAWTCPRRSAPRAPPTPRARSGTRRRAGPASRRRGAARAPPPPRAALRATDRARPAARG